MIPLLFERVCQHVLFQFQYFNISKVQVDLQASWSYFVFVAWVCILWLLKKLNTRSLKMNISYTRFWLHHFFSFSFYSSESLHRSTISNQEQIIEVQPWKEVSGQVMVYTKAWNGLVSEWIRLRSIQAQQQIARSYSRNYEILVLAHSKWAFMQETVCMYMFDQF